MERPRLKGVCFFGGFVEGYPRSDILRKGLEKLGVPVRMCTAWHKTKLPGRYARLFYKFFAMEGDFDVIFVPEFRHKDVPLAALLAKLTGKLCVFDPLVSRYDTKIKDRRDAADRTFQAWHNRNIDRLSMRLPDLVLADTGSHAEYYRSEFLGGGGNVEVLPVGYDETLFEADSRPWAGGKKEGKHKVLFYGTYLPLHGVDTIAEAADLLRDQTDITFELIGGGQTYSNVARYIDQRGLSNVTLTERVPVEELRGRIAASTVCLGIFGNTGKAGRVVPNKVYQCAGMGKAVITERSTAITEIFEDGRDVVLVPPADAAGLAASILELCRDAGKRDRIAQNAHLRVADRYTSVRIAGMFVEVCTAAMEKKVGRRPGRENR